MMRKTNNFTLVEIIAVLLIIAIMAAVAAPKFISLAEEARLGVAQAGVNEAKASLSVALAKVYLTNQTGITAEAVADSAFGDADYSAGVVVTFGEVLVKVTCSGTTATLVATKVGDDVIDTAPTAAPGYGEWTVPTEYH